MNDIEMIDALLVGGEGSGMKVRAGAQQQSVSACRIVDDVIEDFIYRRVNFYTNDGGEPLAIFVPSHIPPEERASYAMAELMRVYEIACSSAMPMETFVKT